MTLTAQENELLCRVGPGTPMGDLFRRYWLPALLTEEIPSPDCPPVRVRLLGENLVAFRDTRGRIGLLAEGCSHRLASLFYGRNEESGLRCIYHGWKYDVEGNILDTPAEPVDSMIKHHVKHLAYPCQEVNGVVYTYMGPNEKMPLLPNFEWITAPPEYVEAGKLLNESNWLQALEGDCDSSHLEFLHRWAGDRHTVGDTLELRPGFGKALAWEVEKGPWYITVASNRSVAEGYRYVRTNWFVPPCIAVIPNPPAGRVIKGLTDGLSIKYQVPVDDYTTARFDMFTSGSVPWDPGRRRNHGDAGPDFRKYQNRSNDYLIDREKQRTSIFSGIDGSTHIQDACVTESMGPICDRTREHLGVCDTEISAMREFLLRAVRELQAGKDPPGLVYDPASAPFGRIYSVNAVLPLGVPWNDRDQVMAHAMEAAPPEP